MITKYIAIAVMGATSLAAISSQADTPDSYSITQTYSFSTNAPFSGTGSTAFLPSGYFSAIFSPFSGKSNELTSFEIDWNVSIAASAVVQAGHSGGFGGGTGSYYLVNSAPYGGGGGGLNSPTVPDGGTIPLTTSIITNFTTFLASDAGVNYNPAILANILGQDPVDLQWPTGFSLGYTSIQSGDFFANGSVTLIYNAVPEPGTLALAGLGASAVCWLRRRKA